MNGTELQAAASDATVQAATNSASEAADASNVDNDLIGNTADDERSFSANASSDSITGDSTTHEADTTNTLPPKYPQRSTSSSSTHPTTAPIDIDDLSCPLCLDLLYDCVTLQCGHSMCRQCLYQALQSKACCPVCREHSFEGDALSLPTTTTINSLCEKLFPIHYHQRQLATQHLKKQRRPRFYIFLSPDPTYPHSHLSLHFFEPRYRILVNRALSGSRQFIVSYVSYERLSSAAANSGMMEYGHHQQPQTFTSSSTSVLYPAQQFLQQQQQQLPAPAAQQQTSNSHIPQLHSQRADRPVRDGEIATLCKFGRVKTFADGRSLVEATGVTRVKLWNVKEELNAYGLLSAEVEELNDEEDVQTSQHAAADEHTAASSSDTSSSQPAFSPHDLHPQLSPSASDEFRSSTTRFTCPAHRSPQIHQLVCAVYDQLHRYIESTHTSLERLEMSAGRLPTPEQDPSELAYFIARVVHSTPERKYRVLTATTTEDRLRAAQLILETSAEARKSATKQQSVIIFVVMLLAVLYQFTTVYIP